MSPFAGVSSATVPTVEPDTLRLKTRIQELERLLEAERDAFRARLRSLTEELEWLAGELIEDIWDGDDIIGAEHPYSTERFPDRGSAERDLIRHAEHAASRLQSLVTD